MCAWFWYSVKHKSSLCSKTGLIKHLTVWESSLQTGMCVCVDMRFNCKYSQKAVKCGLYQIWLFLFLSLSVCVWPTLSYGKDGLLDQVQKRHPRPCANTSDSWVQMFFYGPTDGCSILCSIYCKTNSLCCTECLIASSWCHWWNTPAKSETD